MSTTRRHLREIRREMEQDSGSIVDIKIKDAKFKNSSAKKSEEKPQREIKGIVIENTYQNNMKAIHNEDNKKLK